MFILTLFTIKQITAQTIRGSVMDAHTREALQGASVFWLHSSQGTITDANGVFEISYPTKVPASMVVTYIGYLSDTTPFKQQTELHVRLKP